MKMMREYIFICDEQWKIGKILYDSQDIYVETKISMDEMIYEMPQLREHMLQNQVLLNVHDKQDNREMLAIVHKYERCFLVFLVHIESQEDFVQFIDTYIHFQSWAKENLKPPYQDEYYEIERMNNQLMNSQRALIKNNMQLKKVLNEIIEANNLITVLEHDQLTNLYCAAAFYQKAREKIKKDSQDIIVVDIEHFQMINEIFGRSTGDKLLKDFARFLSGLRNADEGIFCRAYADTFYICMSTNRKFYDELNEKIKRYFSQYPLPVHISVKIGVYSVEDTTISTAQMCDRAFLAMEDVSKKGAGQIGFYNEELHSKLLMEHKILDSIPQALKDHDFLLYLQPKVEMSSKKIVGAEALIRWKHKDFGWIRPDQFIPLLEKRHQIYQIDKYIWEEACKVLKYRKENHLSAIAVSVNVSRDDLYEDDLLDVLKNLITKYELDPKQLHLEIIERAYVDDSEHMYQILTKLREHGFIIEMDDFGTGESSLAMLADMPIDYIKLDRKFLVSGLHDKRHIEVIRAMINLAKTLDIDVLAEGIETKEQEQILYDLGCRYAQGYFYGKPAPDIDFE